MKSCYLIVRFFFLLWVAGTNVFGRTAVHPQAFDEDDPRNTNGLPVNNTEIRGVAGQSVARQLLVQRVQRYNRKNENME